MQSVAVPRESSGPCVHASSLPVGIPSKARGRSSLYLDCTPERPVYTVEVDLSDGIEIKLVEHYIID
jgi:hypothetical protein